MATIVLHPAMAFEKNRKHLDALYKRILQQPSGNVSTVEFMFKPKQEKPQPPFGGDAA